MSGVVSWPFQSCAGGRPARRRDGDGFAQKDAPPLAAKPTAQGFHVRIRGLGERQNLRTGRGVFVYLPQGGFQRVQQARRQPGAAQGGLSGSGGHRVSRKP